jgi:flagellum-specific peptidoglycan hydrolase FlgJ
MVDPQGFINSVLPGAVQIQIETGLPAACMVAQAALETGWGQNVTKDMHTSQVSFNLFNIKGTGPAGSVQALTTECINGQNVEIVAAFRAYHDYQESFADYAALITDSATYARAVAAENDPVAYAQALQECGYATAPNYATEIISITNQYNLVSQAEEAVTLALPITTDANGAIIKNNTPVQAWENQAVATAEQQGLLTQPHNPREIVTMSTLLAILENAKKNGVIV